jgi:hypothetical protein
MRCVMGTVELTDRRSAVRAPLAVECVRSQGFRRRWAVHRASACTPFPAGRVVANSVSQVDPVLLRKSGSLVSSVLPT